MASKTNRLSFRLLPTVVSTFCLLAACTADSEPTTASPEEALVAKFDHDAGIDLGRRTRIILVGDSHKLGTLPLYAGTTRARRYRELYPNDQIVLLVSEGVRDASVVKTGADLVQSGTFGDGGPRVADLRRLDATQIVKALDRFQKIASIDFYGHSSPFGMLLESDGGGRTLSGDVPGSVGALADNFDHDANPYVAMHGCNGGVFTAPKLSKLWKVPVAGNLTASNFQELMSDGHWYFNDDGKFPASLQRASKNTVSYATPAACDNGACVRMRPEDGPYYGVWSNPDTGFQYGLSFLKFFCAYDDANSTCAKGMAQSLYGSVSDVRVDAQATDEQLRDALAEFFCARDDDESWFSTCKANLLRAVDEDLPFSPMRRATERSLECDFTGCTGTEFRCTTVSGGPQQGTCAWVSAGCPKDASPSRCRTPNDKLRTTVNEFKRYVDGHRLLRGS